MAPGESRFANLSQKQQIGLFAGIAVVLAAFFYMYLLKNRIQDLRVLQNENQKLEEEVRQTTAISARLESHKKDLAQLEEQLAVLQSIIPSQKETPSLLKSMQNMAAASNLKINRFEPQNLVPLDFYSEWPIVMTVEGNYHGLGRFFEKTARSARIIDVKDISIKQIAEQNEPGRTLSAVFNATVYVFREEQLEKTGREKKEDKR